MNIEPADLLRPSLQGKLNFDFQELQVQPDTLTIGWLYPLDPSSTTCTESKFRIDIYTESVIKDAETQRDLVQLTYFNSSEHSFRLNMSAVFLPDFFRISHQEISCPSSDYFYNFQFNG